MGVIRIERDLDRNKKKEPASKTKTDKPRHSPYEKDLKKPTGNASKAKGTAEARASNLSKTKDKKNDSIKSKLIDKETYAGKFKSKLEPEKGKPNSKVKTVALASANARIRENADGNAAVEAMSASGGASYMAYKRLNAKKSTIAPNNVLYKKAYKTAKEEAETIKETSGKYSEKVSNTISKAQIEEKKAQEREKIFKHKQVLKYKQSKAKEHKFEETFKKAKETTVKIAKKIAEFAKKNTIVTAVVSSGLLIMITASAGLGSCAMALTSGSETYMSGLSGATDMSMTDVDNYYAEKEMKLEKRIMHIEEEFPYYDEYEYELDPIGHEPLKMMAYLSAVYDAYDLYKVSGVLDQIFDEMYELTFDPVTETRYETVYNPETEEYEEVEVYVQILYVTLVRNDWDAIIAGKFPDADSLERYEIYTDTGGAHQAFYNPFDTDWSSKITSRFGWRINPITGAEDHHNGLDIGMPQGTEIHATCTGKVVTAKYAASEGKYVVIEDETGFKTYYMHMSGFNVSAGQEVKHGDVIGYVGSTGDSTGPHLHIGIKDTNGKWLNPEFLVSSFSGGTH